MYNERTRLAVTSPAQTFTEPLTLAEALEFSRIPAADTTRNSVVTALIAAAREVAEVRQGRDLVTKQYVLTADCLPAADIQLREYAVTVEEFKYRDSTGAWTTLAEDTDYLVDTELSIITPIYGGHWPSFTPWPSSAISITYTVNPPEVGEMVKLGMKYLVKDALEQDNPLAAIGAGLVVYPYTYGLLDFGKREAL